MKKLLFLIFILWTLAEASAHAGGWQVDWNASSRFAGSAGQYMPFWARTGEDGILPVRSSALVTAGTDVAYRSASGIFFEAGVNLAGAVAMKSPLNASPVYGVLDRLYASAGWKMLRMDVGLIPRRGELGPLSVTQGDIMMSGNARNMPGINLSTDWIYFEKGHWVGIKGNLAHYHMIDPRSVMGAMVHNKSISLKLALGRNVDLIGGFHHYAQWGGFSKSLQQQGRPGQQGQDFHDYIKIFFAKRGDASDSESDQLNAFGNHLGNEQIRINWRARAFTMTVQYDKPFEDNSGMKFQNAPDGVWTLQFVMNDREAALTDITYEFISTTWQSGDKHDITDKNGQMVILGGMDNYFNNYPYNSGWTHFGRTIGLPLLFPYAPGADGITPGVMSTRVRGHHVGLSGMVARKVPYRFKATFTENYGTYGKPLQGTPWQLSMALEADLTGKLTRLPVVFSIGAYGDVGQLYPSCAGLTFRVSYAGFKRF